MNNVNFDLDNGKILLDGCVIAPFGLDEFVRTLNAKGIPFEDITRNADWPTYGLKVDVQSQKFWMNVAFNRKAIDSVWLSWDGGITSRKGYDITEKELISDKNALTKFIKKILGKGPEVTEYNHDIFLFEWGYISTSASLHSATVNVGVSWKHLER